MSVKVHLNPLYTKNVVLDAACESESKDGFRLHLELLIKLTKVS